MCVNKTVVKNVKFTKLNFKFLEVPFLYLINSVSNPQT